MDVPPHSTQLVVVFRAFPPEEGVIHLQGVGQFAEIKKQSYRITISAYIPGGSSVERVFVLDPELRVVAFDAAD